MIYFELIFVRHEGKIQYVSIFSILRVDVQLFQLYWLKETIFAPLYCLCYFSKDQLTNFCGSVSGLSVDSLIHLSVLSSVSSCVGFYNL